MTLPPALSRGATLELIIQLRTMTDPEQVERHESRIVEGNLRFCAYQARKYRQQGVEFEDLLAVAAAALLDAVRRFDPTKSSHFAAYARRCIRRDLATTIRRQASPIRLPRTPHRAEREAGRETVASPHILSLDGLRGPARINQSHRRISATEMEEALGVNTSSGTSAGVGDALATEDPTDSLLSRIDGERLAELVARLPDREATVIRMRFGLDGVAPHELAEIGAVISVSKQRVQAILDKAFATLRPSLAVAA